MHPNSSDLDHSIKTLSRKKAHSLLFFDTLLFGAKSLDIVNVRHRKIKHASCLRGSLLCQSV